MQDEMLLEKLKKYGETDRYPFHMPGHKRQCELGITFFPNPFSVDITEIDGFDNLHHAEGILKASMERAAGIYGTDQSWYLVNGSTCGILSAICGLTRPGDRILMARNSHKAAYHAVMLHRLEPVFLYPEELEEEGGRMGILGGISPEQVKQKLEEEPGISAVFLTSPTYEGIVSDIRAIARLAHAYGIPLIVDEAHGAHFPFGESWFPASAVDCGADVVIQSLHKTLPSLTQTAILHLKSVLVKPKQLERYLSVFQSSSPSYVFLASMENCVSYMAGEGRQRMEEYGKRLSRWMTEAKTLRNLRLLDDRICGRNSVWGRDPSKLVVLPPGGDFDGVWLEKMLREEYHLEAEMVCSRYVILMTSLMDTEEGLSRLLHALRELDLCCGLAGETGAETAAMSVPMAQKGKTYISTWLKETVLKMAPADAWNSDSRMISLEEAKGHVCSGFVTIYPPGVPMLVPGEELTAEAIQLIEENRGLGLTVEGITEADKIPVVEKE